MIVKPQILILSMILPLILLAESGVDWQNMKSAVRQPGEYRVWVYFTDKETPVLERNAVKLTSRSMERRQSRGRNKDLTSRDYSLNPDYIKLIRQTGAIVRNRSRWLNAVSVSADNSQIEKIARLSFVTEVKPVGRSTRKLLAVDNISHRLNKQNKTTTLDYGYSQDQIEQINVNTAHDHGYFGQGVLILMIDTGFNLTHPAFDSLNIVAQWDFINHDGVTANQDNDVYGQDHHGTETFSVTGGYLPGEYIAPAFRADYLLAKTENVTHEIQQEEDDFVAAVEWGDSLGADLISSSLGYLDWYEYQDLDGNTAVTTNIFDYAASIGITCVNSAGNEGGSSWFYIMPPADADSVISVGAVDSDGVIAGFSSHGPTYDNRIKPEVMARGLATAAVNPGGSGYFLVNGTSFSAPLVSGAAAVILSAHPEWNPDQVRNALMMTADNAADPDNSYGYGIIDTWAAINYTSNGIGDPFSLPAKFDLSPAYPNPFNPATNFTVNLAEDTNAGLKIYSLRGELLATVFEGWITAGSYEFRWEAGNYPSGIYFARLTAGTNERSRKLILLK